MRQHLFLGFLSVVVVLAIGAQLAGSFNPKVATTTVVSNATQHTAAGLEDFVNSKSGQQVISGVLALVVIVVGWLFIGHIVTNGKVSNIVGLVYAAGVAFCWISILPK